MNIYLDIDGVLLANDKQAAIGAGEFLLYLLDHYNVYWLTTHVKGDTVWVKRYLSDFFSPVILDRLHEIKPTDWEVHKTEVIDFEHPFLWFDDDLYPDERALLERFGAMENWVEVDLAKDPHQLEKILAKLKAKQPKRGL